MWTRTTISICVLLVGLSAFPEALGKSAQQRAAVRSRLRRRLQFGDGLFIWGTCDDWTHNVTGCTLEDGLKCSSHLSDGPTDYDVSLTITALPPSTEDAPIYLQWWAARKSKRTYFPQFSPHGCYIYGNIKDAYPHYEDTDFNGGNVQVSANGTATIRVRAPATYRVSRWVLLPHIHLRLCSGVNFAHSSADSIFFTWFGPRLVKGSHGASHAAMLNGSWTPNSTAGQTTTTTLAIDLSSTTTTVLQESEEGESMDDALIQEAIDALDMDALEFSPIYQCLLQNKFYSYWTSTCVQECPSDADVVVGQCVTKAVSETPTTLESAWSLEVACAEYCWHDKLNVTLHHVRIAVADQMKIPFQEVTKVTLAISRTLASRRLSNTSATHVATLKVSLASTRVKSDDLALLENFIDETSSASWLLGFDVYEVAHISIQDADADTAEDDDILEITNSSDPYANAYDEVAPLPYHSSEEGSFVSLPFFMAVAALSVCCSLSMFCLYRRRHVQSNPEAEVVLGDGNMMVVSGRPTSESDLPAWVDLGKPSLMGASGAHIPEPTKPSPSRIPEPTKPNSAMPSAAAAGPATSAISSPSSASASASAVPALPAASAAAAAAAAP
mmetsp:Transcript_83515/g.183582  ORF Transcript_83515/g.183582 Transcript_83515/m.183582 type:complete len:614 (-) Transcript_83515:375-2216(-)